MFDESILNEVELRTQTQMDEMLINYLETVQNTIQSYIEFNTFITNQDDGLVKIAKVIDQMGKNAQLSTLLLRSLMYGLNISNEQMKEGLDKYGITLDIKTPTLFDHTEDLVDKLGTYANIYKNKYMGDYMIYEKHYQVIIHNGVSMKKSISFNHNAFLISHVITNKVSALRKQFNNKDNPSNKYMAFRELAIVHCVMIRELQITRKTIGW